MIDSKRFDALKRTLAFRLLTKMPDEALGELLYSMREIMEHYGSLDSESFENTISRQGIITLEQMRDLLRQIDKPTTANTDEIETQEAEVVMSPMIEDQLDSLTRPIDRPPAISTREAFQVWLEEQV